MSALSLRPALPGLYLVFLLIAPAAAFEMAYAPEVPAAPDSAAVAAIERAAPISGNVMIAPIPATMPPALRDRDGRLSAAERKCLATAIYFEARGETTRGQIAVAQVVLNRVRAGGFPKTVCGVVYQGRNRTTGCQFSFACDGQPDRIAEKKAWRQAEKIAEDVAAGRRQIAEIEDATHYHATYVSPYWAPTMKRLMKIGQHVFYYERGRLPRKS